jgi:hypothetical protein
MPVHDPVTSAKLPAALGPQTAAGSVSVTPSKDTPVVIMNAVTMTGNQTSSVVDLRGREDWSIQYYASAVGTHAGILEVNLCNDQTYWPTTPEVIDPVPTAANGVLFSDGITIPTCGFAYGRVRWVGSGTGNLTLTSNTR